LIDKSPKELARKIAMHPTLIAGQLITPLTRYSNAGIKFAFDCGGYTRFDAKEFRRLLGRDRAMQPNCLFVVVPDIVGSARRTLEIWKRRRLFIPSGWKLAFVAQDGCEDMEIPWDELDALFLGGRDPWKDSQAAMDIIKTAKILEKHSHIGRVNEIKRYKRYAEIGADTCDGSGVAMYDHMLDKLASGLAGEESLPLLEGV